jgi:hypothetical protein
MSFLIGIVVGAGIVFIMNILFAFAAAEKRAVVDTITGLRGAEKVTLPDGSEQWVYWRKDKP